MAYDNRKGGISVNYDCEGVPLRDHDCVAQLTEKFAMFGPEGKDVEYGIVYGSKWILSLGRTKKRQLEASDCVKLTNRELLPYIKEQLYALYAYFDKYQQLPEADEDYVRMMADAVRAYETQHI